MNPPTDIHNPLAKATKANEMTKLGTREVIKTTRDSAANKSRNIHMTQVKKAVAVGWKFDSQYEMTEKTIEIGVISGAKRVQTTTAEDGKESEKPRFKKLTPAEVKDYLVRLLSGWRLSRGP